MSEIMQTKKYFESAVSSVLNGTDFVLSEDADCEKIFSLAKRNAVSGILFAYFKDNKDIPVYEKLTKEYKLSAIRDNEQAIEIEKIRKDFSDNQIDFMLLKGTHLKNLYPRPELRFMVDTDVLVREKDAEKAYEIIMSHGLSKRMESDKDFVFVKEPFLTVEVHKTLFHPDNPFYSHFKCAFDNAEKCGEFEYKMSDNDLYVYTLAHLCEHYWEAGSCFRPCMDLYLLQKKSHINFEYTDGEFRKLGILPFAENIKRLLLCMFENKEADETLTMMENYIILGPPVKNAEAAAKTAQNNGSKTKRAVKSLFPPISHMKHKYHVLIKLPFLLPLFWIVRIISILFSKDGKIQKKRNEMNAVDKNSVDIMNEIFKKSGLK